MRILILIWSLALGSVLCTDPAWATQAVPYRSLELLCDLERVGQEIPLVQEQSSLYGVGICDSKGEITLVASPNEVLTLEGHYNHSLTVLASTSSVVMKGAQFKGKLRVDSQNIRIEAQNQIQGEALLIAHETLTFIEAAHLVVNGLTELQAKQIELSGELSASRLVLKAETLLFNNSLLSAENSLKLIGFQKLNVLAPSRFVSGGDYIVQGQPTSQINYGASTLYVDGVYYLSGGTLIDSSKTYGRGGSFLNLSNRYEHLRGALLLTDRLVLSTGDLKLNNHSDIAAMTSILIRINGEDARFKQVYLNGRISTTPLSDASFLSNVKNLKWIKPEQTRGLFQGELKSLVQKSFGSQGIQVISEADVVGEFESTTDGGFFIDGKRYVNIKAFISNEVKKSRDAEVRISGLKAKLDLDIQSTQSILIQSASELQLKGDLYSQKQVTLKAKQELLLENSIYSEKDIIVEADQVNARGNLATGGSVSMDGKEVHLAGKLTSKAESRLHATQLAVSGSMICQDGVCLSSKDQIVTSGSISTQGPMSLSAPKQVFQSGAALSSRQAEIQIQGNGGKQSAQVTFEKGSHLTGQRVLVDASELKQEGHVSGEKSVKLNISQGKISGTILSESGCVSIGDGLQVCNRVDILADAHLGGQAVVIRTADMLLDGQIQGQQGVRLEWHNFDSQSLRGAVKTDGRFTLQGNVSSGQTLDLLEHGAGGKISAHAIEVATDQRVVLDRDLNANHGVLLHAKEIEIEQGRTLRNNQGPIFLSAHGGSIILNEDAQIHTQGHLQLDSAQNISTKAVKVSAESMEMKAAGQIVDQAVMQESKTERSIPNGSEVFEEVRAKLSQFKVNGELSMQGHDIILQATQAEAASISLEAKNRVVVLGVNESSKQSRTTEKETGWWFWSGTETESTQTTTSTFKAAQLRSKEPITIKAKEVTLQAPKLESPETRIEADSVKFLLGKNIECSSSNKSSENAFWMSQEMDKRSDEFHTQLQTLGPLKIKASKIELEEVKEHTLEYLEHLEFDGNQVEQVRKVLEEIHIQEHDSISAPGPALIAAVAIAASVATGGVGGAAVAGLGCQAAGGLVAATTSVAISSLSAQVVTQLAIGILAQQSPGDIMGKIFSLNTLKSMAIATVSAGALYEVGGLQNTTATCVPLRHLENAGVQACVGITADVAFGDKNLGDALTSGGIQLTSQFLGSAATSEIGDHFKDKQGATDRLLHKAVHGIAASGVAASGAALTGQDVGAAAAAAAAGAMTAEIVADLLTTSMQQDVLQDVKKQQAEKGRALTQEEVKEIWNSKTRSVAQIAKLTGAVSGLMTGSSDGLNRGNQAASTAIENNFAPTLLALWPIAGPAIMEAAAGTFVIGSAVILGRALNEATDSAEDSAGEAPIKVNGPSESKQWKELEPYRGKTKTSGEGKEQRYYEWDRTHNDIEVYDRRGKHLGSMEPTTGEIYKPAVPGRKIDL